MYTLKMPLANGCFEEIHEQCTIPILYGQVKVEENMAWPDILLLYEKMSFFSETIL